MKRIAALLLLRAAIRESRGFGEQIDHFPRCIICKALDGKSGARGSANLHQKQVEVEQVELAGPRLRSLENATSNATLNCQGTRELIAVIA